MIQKIRTFVEENHMLEYKDKVVVGVSGGADSVCLFFVLLELQKYYDLSLIVVHINHGIRGEEAERDQIFVESLCKEHRIDCRVFYYSVQQLAKKEKVSEEEMGRRVRYQSFFQVLKEEQCQKIAVAHNQNDQSETMLLNLFRGSGLKGLSGILPVRGVVIRPLLMTTRKEIELFLEERKLSFQIDKTNLEEDYTRNKIRLSLIPYIEREINERASEHIAKATGMLREAEEYIRKRGLFVKDAIVTYKNGKYSFCVEAFLQEESIIQREVLRQILEELTSHLKDIEAEHIKMILELCKKQVGKEIHLPYGIVVSRGYQEITMEIRASVTSCKKEIIAVQPDVKFQIVPKIQLQNQEIPKNNCTKWFDYDKIANIVMVRHRKQGDYFQLDNHGNIKKLNRYFIDKKIPKEQRDSVLLLADGSHIIWIIGDRISEAYKIDENTKNVLIVNVNGGQKDVGNN